MPAEDDVRGASEFFYAALNRMGHGEKGVMSDSRSHGPAVTAMHPIGGRTVGWEAVRHQFVQVHGDLADELGVEQGEFTMAGQLVRLEHRVTSIDRREAAGWKLVHHNTDTSPGMLEVLSRLRSPAAQAGRQPGDLETWRPGNLASWRGAAPAGPPEFQMSSFPSRRCVGGPAAGGVRGARRGSRRGGGAPPGHQVGRRGCGRRAVFTHPHRRHRAGRLGPQGSAPLQGRRSPSRVRLSLLGRRGPRYRTHSDAP